MTDQTTRTPCAERGPNCRTADWHTPAATAAPDDRRNRYAAALAAADGLVWSTIVAQYPADAAEYRAEAHAAMAVADTEQQELRAEVERLRTDQAAVLDEAATALKGQTCGCGCRRGAEFIQQRADHLRRLADEAQQPDTIGLCAACGDPREGHHHGYERTPHFDDEAQQPETETTPAEQIRDRVNERLKDCVWITVDDEPLVLADSWPDARSLIDAIHTAAGLDGTEQPAPAPSEAQQPETEAHRSYRLEHRTPGESTWQPNTPGIGANWSWESREKADQRLAESRDRWPDYEHRLIETVATVTETPTAPAPTEEPTP